MKKRMKKLAALALAACMFALITACGSNEQATKEEPVKEETVSVVSEVNTESVAGIEKEEPEADKETEVEAKSEVETKEETEAEVKESAEEREMRKVITYRIENGTDKAQDKEFVELVKNFMVEPLNRGGTEEERKADNLAQALNHKHISAEKFEEIYWSINP